MNRIQGIARAATAQYAGQQLYVAIEQLTSRQFELRCKCKIHT